VIGGAGDEIVEVGRRRAQAEGRDLLSEGHRRHLLAASERDHLQVRSSRSRSTPCALARCPSRSSLEAGSMVEQGKTLVDLGFV